VKRYCPLISVVLLAGLNSTGCAAERAIVARQGGKVSVVRLSNGAWELRIGQTPHFVKGVVYVPVKIGEDPSENSMQDWLQYDDNGNGKNDMAHETWLAGDSKRQPVGDFEFLRRMGANTIRVYHSPSDSPSLEEIYKGNPSTSLQFDHAINKPLLRELSQTYGIRVAMGHFLGAWTIGSGATWDEGTDYTNPKHREAIKKSVYAMVRDSKDEPYVLLWMLGNENNIADFSRCNAKARPEAYARLIGELTDMIHKLDPNHPVAICDGDDQFRMLRYYAKHAPQIDIIGYNAYRGESGFGDLWAGAKNILDRPVLISEYGTFAYISPKGEDEEYQLRYLKGSWKDIVQQSASHFDPAQNRAGNSIGGMVFDWVDRWYMDGKPQEHNPGTATHWNSPDRLTHSEYFGVMALDGVAQSDSLSRRPRLAYDYFKDVWNKSTLSF
jgi:hypothetical protein